MFRSLNNHNFLRFIVADTPAGGDGSDTTQDEGETTPKPAGEETSPELTIDDYKKIVSDLRKEAGKERVNAKKSAADEARNEVLDEVAKALGLKDTEKPTVESLQTTLTAKDTELAEAQTERDRARVELAVLRAAGPAKADADLLLDSQSFRESLADLDLSDTNAITEAVKTWVKDNPKYASTQVLGASSIENTGGTGETPIGISEFRAMDLRERANYARTKPAEFQTLADQI